MRNYPLEADVRVQVDERLKNLGWLLDGKDKNVFLEQPKTEKEKKRLKGKKPDYVLYEKGRDTPLMIIETKKRGGNINSALIQGRDYAKALDIPIVFATDGVFYKSLHTETEKNLVLNGEEVDELIREITALKYLEIGTNQLDTIPKQVQVSRKELINIFEDANNFLRVEGLRAGIERFSEFSNILFLKLFSEIDNLRDKPDFDRKYKWDFYKGKPEDEILDYINKIVLPEIGVRYNDENIFNPLQIKDGKIVKKIIDKLDPLLLTDINSDIKGDAFEYFLKSTSGTGNDLGEYFTPRHIVKTMVKLANPKIGEKVYDPFCGTGGMLIESFRHIYNTMPRNDRTIRQLKQETIYGNEITNTARITKMNMILAGDGHSNIKMQNSLANPISNKYDVILTNMPYSQKTDYGSYYDIPTKNGDSVCVQHCIKAIDKTAENGRIVMVVPEGFLFKKSLKKTREYMLDRCKLQSIVSLPQGVFLPYTGVKTNIVYLTKVNSESTKKNYWYFEVKNDGYSLDNNRRKLNGKNDIESFLENRKISSTEEEEIENIGFKAIEIDTIRKNDYVLSGNRYKDISDVENKKYNYTALEECCDIINGSTPSTTNLEYWENGKINWFTIEDIRKQGREIYITEKKITAKALKETSIKIIPKDSLLLCCTASVGEFAMNKIPLTMNQQFNALIIKEKYKNKLLPKFLFYLSLKFKEIIETIGNSTSFNYISAQTLKKIKIPIPDLEEQERIIEELDSYNNIIKGNSLSHKSYMNNFKFPNGCEYMSLGKICEFSGGTQPPKSNFIYEPKEGYIRLLQIRDYKSDDNAVYIPNHLNHKTCEERDIMIGRYGPPVFQILKGKKGAYNVALIKCIPNRELLLDDWLYYFLSSKRIQNHIIGLSERSRQSGVSLQDLKKLEIPLPSIEEQKKYINEIKEEEKLIDTNKIIADIFLNKMKNRVSEIWNN